MGLLDENGLGGLKGATDLVTDSEGNFYIADSSNNRIVILDRYTYKVTGIIDSYVDEYGKLQTFNSPQGLYVTNPNKMVDGSESIFVCDTANARVIQLDKDFGYIQTITVPDDPAEGEVTSSLITKKDFAPTAIAVDIYGRLFVVSKNCYSGVIVMSGEGDFTGFIGAQKVTSNLIDMIWQNFQN